MLNKKSFYFFNEIQKKRIVLLIFCMFLACLLEMIGLSLIFPIAGLILESSSIDNSLFVIKFTSLFNITLEQALPYALLLFIVFYVVKTFFLIWYTWLENSFLFSFRESLSSSLFKRYINQSFSYFQGRNSSEFLRNLTNECDQFLTYLICALKFLLETLILVGILGFLIYVNWSLTLVIGTIFFLLTTIYLKSFKEKLNEWGVRRQFHAKKRIQFMQEGFDGVKIIKLLGREDFFFHKFRKHNLDLSNLSTIVGFFNNLPKLVFELLVIFALVLAFFIMFNNKINFAEIAQLLAVYAVASIRIIPSANRIITSLQIMKYNNPSVNILDSEFKNFRESKDEDNKEFNFKENILVNIKKFKHSKKSKFEIKNIQLKINKGDKVGIVGSSGSGKSSLVDIMTGVFKPDDGEILVDGKSIFSNLRGWQSLIGYVPQKIFILDDSLRNNILFGLNSQKYKDSTIYQLIEKMNLNTLLGRLNNKLDEKLDEKGLNLSVGEIQRIGICRALIYDPQVLFLDEATSSLDTFTEQQILNELKLFQEKTIISIAHRINTLKNCSKIYCINNGKVVDQGNFDKFKKQN